MKAVFLGLIGLLLLVSGCSLAVSPAVNSVELTGLDFSNANSLKKSKSCATFILGFIGPFGDAQIMSAIKAGNIKKVYSVDYESSYDIILRERCVVVHGE